MDRKNKIDMHTNIATAVLDQIKVMSSQYHTCWDDCVYTGEETRHLL